MKTLILGNRPVAERRADIVRAWKTGKPAFQKSSLVFGVEPVLRSQRRNRRLPATGLAAGGERILPPILRGRLQQRKGAVLMRHRHHRGVAEHEAGI